MATSAPGQAPAPVASTVSLAIYGELVLMGLIFGLSPVASKYAAEGFPVLPLAALRVLIASAAFVPVILIFERRFPIPPWRDVARFVLLGACGFLGFSVLFFYGIGMTTASHGVIFLSAGPMITAILAFWILREALTGERLSGIGLTMCGVALIVWTTSADLAEGSVGGALAILAAMTCWSFYGIFSGPLIARYGAIVVTGYSVMAGAVLLTPFALISGLNVGTLTAAPTESWLGIGFSALVATVLSYILWNRGVAQVGPTLTMIFINTAPVWGFVTAFVIRGEAITVWHILSSVLVVGGVFLANRTVLLQQPSAACARGSCVSSVPVAWCGRGLF